MALSRFWLLNGSKKKGKKSAKKITRKTIKKVTVKKVSKPKVKKVVRKVVKEKVYVAKPVKSLPTKLLTKSEKKTIKNIRRKETMAKRRIKRSVAKATKRVKRAKRKIASYGKHRVVAIMHRDGQLRTSRKSKIAKRNYKINPFKFSTKGIVKELTPAVVISASSVGTIYGLNKVLPMIPYVNRVDNAIAKSAIKVGAGLVGSMLVKKVLKTKGNNIANGVLIGSIIGAMLEFLSAKSSVATNGIKLNGIKVMGSPLSFGRPKTALANPNFTMNGIKIANNKDMGAIRFKKAVTAVDGLNERY